MVCTEYVPGEEEAIVIAGFEVMDSAVNKARLAEIKKGDRKPIMIHMSDKMHAGNSFIAEKEALRIASGGAVHLDQYGRNTESLKGEKLDKKKSTHAISTTRPLPMNSSRQFSPPTPAGFTMKKPTSRSLMRKLLANC